MKISRTVAFFCVWNSGLSISLGLLIYILFRDNTYIHQIFMPVLHCGPHVIIDFLRFNLVDFLWAYSLVCALSIFIHEAFAGTLAISFGISWELLQKFSVIHGTFDWLDIVMYITASLTAVLVLFQFKRRHKS